MSLFSNFKQKAESAYLYTALNMFKHGTIFYSDDDENFIEQIYIDTSSEQSPFSNVSKPIRKIYLMIRRGTTQGTLNKQLFYIKSYPNKSRFFTINGFLCCEVDNMDLLLCLCHKDISLMMSTNNLITLNLSSSKLYKLFHEDLINEMDWKISRNLLGYKVTGEISDLLRIIRYKFSI